MLFFKISSAVVQATAPKAFLMSRDARACSGKAAATVRIWVIISAAPWDLAAANWVGPHWLVITASRPLVIAPSANLCRGSLHRTGRTFVHAGSL